METRPCITGFVCSWLLACLAAVTAHALPKTDTVILYNGDRTTCEIKEMVRGKLKVKTVGMGTAYIEWDKIVRVDSHYAFLVKTREGLLAFGRLPDSGTDGELLVAFAEHEVRFPLIDVVEIQPSRLELWDRLSLAASLGFNYTKATEITQIFLDASADYRGQIYSWGAGISSTLSETGTSDLRRRVDSSAYLRRRLTGQFNTSLNAGYQRNDELGLRARLLGGGALGYEIVTTNHLVLNTGAGLNLTREWASSLDDPAENNLEARFDASFSLFFYDSPKTDLRLQAAVIPNLTTEGRVRFELDTTLRYELITDLFLELTYYESQDNKPPAGASGKIDRGIVFSLGWSK